MLIPLCAYSTLCLFHFVLIPLCVYSTHPPKLVLVFVRNFLSLLNVSFYSFNLRFLLFIYDSVKFIKASSDSVFDMKKMFIKTNPLFIRSYVSGEARLPSSGSQFKLLNTFEFIKAVSDTVFDMINAVYHH